MSHLTATVSPTSASRLMFPKVELFRPYADAKPNKMHSLLNLRAPPTPQKKHTGN